VHLLTGQPDIAQDDKLPAPVSSKFGSEATGTAGPDSDIDILIALDSEVMPADFRERSDNYLQISRAK
jgi:predicted nucleotidyltransferase